MTMRIAPIVIAAAVVATGPAWGQQGGPVLFPPAQGSSGYIVVPPPSSSGQGLTYVLPLQSGGGWMILQPGKPSTFVLPQPGGAPQQAPSSGLARPGLPPP
jgi:hypothetical protein